MFSYSKIARFFDESNKAPWVHKFKSCHANLKLKSQDTNKNLDKKSLRSGHSEKYPARPTFSSSNLKKKNQ